MEDSLFGGETVTITLPNGDKAVILVDLSQGIDEDLYEYDRKMGGTGGALWAGKLMQLATVRIERKDGEVLEPVTLDHIRALKSENAGALREEVMARLYPLGWAALLEMEAEDLRAIRTASGELSTSIQDSAPSQTDGSSGPTSLERLGGHIGNTEPPQRTLLRRLNWPWWPRRRQGNTPGEVNDHPSN